MRLDLLILVLAGVFFLLYGLFAVTSIKVDWGPTIMGFVALVLGVLCLIRAAKA